MNNLQGRKLGKVFMGFGKVVESTDVQGFAQYVGVGNFQILAVNPTKAELEAIYGRELEREPEYLGKTTIQGISGEFDQVRIDFIVKSVADKNNGIEMIDKVSFFVVNTPHYSTTGKVRVLNKYGETTWLEPDFVKSGTVPSNMSWYNTDGMKVAHRGEVELIDFLKAWLAIPIRSWKDRNTGKEMQIDNFDDAKASLGKVKDYFKGDVSELKEIAKALPNQMVKILFGIRTTDEGRTYQNAFNRYFLKYRNTTMTGLTRALNEALANGAYSTTAFQVCPLKEFSLEATDFNSGATTSAPNAEAGTVDPNDDLPF